MGTIYKVIVETSVPKLELAVTHYLLKGWKLAGGIAVDAGGFKYQSIFREAVKGEKDAESGSD